MSTPLRVNGASHDVDAPPDTPLLWVLRDILNLTGTKFGCGAGLCGACTVHVDNVATRSCLLPLAAVGRKDVRTIEGLAGDADHPLQRLWKELDVPQCGYCQAGQLMTAAALFRREPRPSVERIDAAMTGNLCRCGTYPRIREALRRHAERVEGRP